ncbi:family 43 glycosylhydrolase [Plantactinospora sp. DSM 117369]
MRLTRLRSVIAAVAVCVVGSVGAVTAVTAASAAAGCSATYRIGSQWPGGFTGTVDLTNLGDPLDGWALTWSFTAGQQVSQGWSAVFSQSGTQVTARNQSWNAGLGTGAQVSIGFNASWNNSTNPAPTNLALNGVACTGATAPTSAVPTTGAPTTAPPTTAPPRTTFTNPLKTRGPDPWLTYYNGYYYLATTTWNNTITMRRSRTLGGLATAPDTLLFTLTRPNGAGTMWAPEFHLLDGPNGRRWYFYYTAGREPFDLGSQRIHVLESAGLDPMGPYTFKADLLDPTADNTWELDPGILQLNGNLYLLGTFYNGSQPMFIRPLSNPWTASGTRRILSTPTYSWETVGGAVNEGAEVLQRNGRTFIVYSASHCSTPDYKLGMLTYNGGDPLNSSSWVKSPQPVFQRSNANGVYGPGHNGFFTSPDGTEDWIVYHANSSANGGCDMNRSTRAQKFTWNADGTPNFGTPVPLGAQLAVPSGEPAA